MLDKMCKYEVDLATIAEDTEWTQFCPQIGTQTDGQTNRPTDDPGETSIPPFNFVEQGV